MLLSFADLQKMVNMISVNRADYTTEGEKIEWSEAEESAITTKRLLAKRSAPPPPKRRKKISSTTGVGVRRRVTAPPRPRALALNLGIHLKYPT